MGESVKANRNTRDLLRSDLAPARMLDAPVTEVMLDELSEPVLVSHCRAALGRDKPTPDPIARTVSSGVDELASNSDWVMPPEQLTPRELEVWGCWGAVTAITRSSTSWYSASAPSTVTWHTSMPKPACQRAVRLRVARSRRAFSKPTGPARDG